MAKNEAYYLACLAGISKLDVPALSVAITFFPPDRRHRDLDNMLASLKAALDGIALAVGIDDSRWTLTLSKGAPIDRSGMVKVTLCAPFADSCGAISA